MGNIPVPGCVWKRDRAKAKQEKVRRSKISQEEDEHAKALKQSQEEVLKFLAAKRKHPDEGGDGRRFREEPGSSRDDYDRRADDRDHGRSRRDADFRDSRSPRRGDDRRRRDDRGDDRSRDTRRRRDDYDESDLDDDDGRDEGRWETTEDKDPVQETTRKAKLLSAFAVANDDEKGKAEKIRVVENKIKKQEEDKKRKKKLSGAFGLDDEDDDAQRNLEFAAAAAAKRSAQKRQMLSHPISSAGSAAAPAAGPTDTYAALKAMADFKRACNGATKQIPEHLKALVMQASRHSQ